MHRKRKCNSNSLRLLKQVSLSNNFEFLYDFKVKKIRFKSYYNQLYDMKWYDLPYSSKPIKNWKKHRKNQWK